MQMTTLSPTTPQYGSNNMGINTLHLLQALLK